MIRSIISVFAFGTFFIFIFHAGFTLCMKVYFSFIERSPINYTFNNFKEAVFIGITVGGGTAIINCIWLMRKYKK
ncbi:hypothetical protein EZJ58_3188 [Sodalis ligni]|uniref:Uncharacterized protein n=1 Tax=Sodalis ligni TaxID=2697027 RepID=A0A4R1NC10_9GAMM|nr:hypothetical protein EZJ58_3188 [Sodalis ligni]